MPPDLRAVTGLSSIRLDVSAARRMSASPIVRTFSAWAANPGLPIASLVRAVRKLSTLESSSGTISAATWGAILGAAVSVTGLGASGAVRVSTASGGASGLGSGAAAEPSVVMG